jgi:hypothetical protein
MFKCHAQFGTPSQDVLSLTPPKSNTLGLTPQKNVRKISVVLDANAQILFLYFSRAYSSVYYTFVLIANVVVRF